MFQVLIADDERLIREGLNGAIDWESYGFSVCGLAANGTIAFQMIKKFRPELVIVDIKMPGMDGLELISRAQESGLDTAFVVLSGYSEFDYAKRAMGLGVKYYLTKPCQEPDLISTLESVRRDIQNEREKRALLKDSLQKYQDAVPNAEDHLLQKVISGEKGAEEAARFWDLFGMKKLNVRVLVFRFEEGTEWKARLGLRDLISAFTGKLIFSRCIFYRDDAVAVVNAMEWEEIRDLAQAIAEDYRKRYPGRLSAAFSVPGSFDAVHGMFVQAAACIRHDLELDESSAGKMKKPVFHFPGEKPADLGTILGSVRRDDLKSIESGVLNILSARGRENRDPASAGLCLCLNLAFEIDPGGALSMMDKLCGPADAEDFRQIVLHTTALILEIAARSRSPRAETYSGTTKKAVRYIEGNLDRSNLSLSHLSRDVLFMNEDYVGKLFFKETGEKFSQYVTGRRIRRAIALFRSAQGGKIFEVCAKSGFGANTQYFSQVFKKRTGFTPSEFQKIP